MEVTKLCPKCGRILPVSEFYTRVNGKGIQSWCKDCCRSHGRLRNGTTGIWKLTTEKNIKEIETMEQNLNFDKRPADCPYKSTTKWEWITPDMARDVLLHHNHYNRKTIAELQVQQIFLSMQNGTFDSEAGIIQFRYDNELLNGQHRFTALVRYGKGMWFNVQRGIGFKAMEHIDQGIRIRNIADRLDISGKEDVRDAATPINTYLLLLHKLPISGSTSALKRHYTDDDKIILINKFHDQIVKISNWVKKHRSRVFSPAIEKGYILFLTEEKRHPIEFAEDFFEKFCDNGVRNNIQGLLYSKLLSESGRGAVKLNGLYKTCIINKTWNTYVQGGDKSVLKFNPNIENYIELI